jgi:hypothetical protein
MESSERFSLRQGFRPQRVEITVREDAPTELREAVLQIAVDRGLGPNVQRSILCRILRKLPNPGNWSEYPNVWGECQDLLLNCEWYKVYDYIEALHERLMASDQDAAAKFTDEINQVFEELGIGWQLTAGHIEIRGPESFEAAVTSATEATSADRPTAQAEIHEALMDLSRRPNPDLTGAVHHAMAALECVARDITGDDKATLGEILKKHPDLLPKPLDAALSKVWGYASETGRHVREGNAPDTEDAQLVVGLAASAVTYLAKKNPKS